MSRGELIVIHAQHPLENGVLPDGVFARRLDEGLKASDSMDATFYVPGSRHLGDAVSLPHAGRQYLLGKGMSGSDVHGDDWNGRYGRDGRVLNGADEAAAASTGFTDGGYDRLIAVCSDYQVRRLGMHHSGNGADAVEFLLVPESLAFYRGIAEVAMNGYTHYFD